MDITKKITELEQKYSIKLSESHKKLLEENRGKTFTFYSFEFLGLEEIVSQTETFEKEMKDNSMVIFAQDGMGGLLTFEKNSEDGILFWHNGHTHGFAVNSERFFDSIEKFDKWIGNYLESIYKDNPDNTDVSDDEMNEKIEAKYDELMEYINMDRDSITFDV